MNLSPYIHRKIDHSKIRIYMLNRERLYLDMHVCPPPFTVAHRTIAPSM